MVTSKWRGHDIEIVDDVWVYSDTKEPCKDNPNIKCGKCGNGPSKEGHDDCIKGLPYPVINACCGHGENGNAVYVQFEGRETLYGDEAHAWIKRNKEIIR